MPSPPAGSAWQVYSEGWDPAHGLSSQFDDEGGGEAEQAEPGPLVVARQAATPLPLAFVDGTRRAELSLWAENPATGARVPGLAGAYAVGAVTVRPGSPATYAGIRVGRLAIWGGGHTGHVTSRNGYRWASTPIAGTEQDELLAHLQDRMRRAEGELALEAADAGWNVVLDGPLNRIRTPDGLVAGYVKSHHRRILPADAHAVVPTLGLGQRTRVFTAGTDRFTCYFRVGFPAPGSSPWSGIARLEFSAASGLSFITARASQLASLLPTYAGVHHRDERAPVNLTPVKTLEQRLARTLGRVDMASRAARDAIAAGVPR